jgi:DNA-binding IclR family transcriptional regulator
VIGGVPRPRTDQPHAAALHARHPVERAVGILEVLAEAVDGLGVSEIARRAGIPKTSAARVLANLVAAGMVVQDRRVYVPGPRLIRLAGNVVTPGGEGLRRLLMPYITLLRDETGLEVAFAVIRRGRVHFDTPIYGPALSPVLTSLPLWAPVHCTATGKALLAFMGSANVGWPSQAPLARYTDATITSPDALAQELMQIRRAGFATGRSEYIEGIDGVAAPVFGTRRRSIGALAVCGRSDEFDWRVTGSTLRRVAGSVSTAVRSLG